MVSLLCHSSGLLPISSLQIGAVSFHHCTRETNKAAHNLARLRFELDCYFVGW
jgi:hypothetical protein